MSGGLRSRPNSNRWRSVRIPAVGLESRWSSGRALCAAYFLRFLNWRYLLGFAWRNSTCSHSDTHETPPFDTIGALLMDAVICRTNNSLRIGQRSNSFSLAQIAANSKDQIEASVPAICGWQRRWQSNYRASERAERQPVGKTYCVRKTYWQFGPIFPSAAHTMS